MSDKPSDEDIKALAESFRKTLKIMLETYRNRTIGITFDGEDTTAPTKVQGIHVDEKEDT